MVVRGRTRNAIGRETGARVRLPDAPPTKGISSGWCLFLRLDGADENRAAIFDVQHKSISLPKVPIQQNLALKCNPAELLCGVGHLNGAKALQVAANSGGVGDDKGRSAPPGANPAVRGCSLPSGR